MQPPNDAPTRRRNPWWIPIWLGRAPTLAEAEMRMLGLAVLGTFFESYDLSLLSSALKHIGEELGIEGSAQAYMLALVRVGGFIAFALLPLADRLGRRRVFLATVVGMSIGTFATAFAQSEAQFVVAQIAARTFMLMSAALGVVMVAEELSAQHRGWGIGMVGALGAFGYGLGALLFAFVDHLPFGWRALYVVGAAPILALPAMRRSLRETKRFTAYASATSPAADQGWLGWARPIVGLARAHPGRTLCIGLVGFTSSFGTIAVFNFAAKFLQTYHGWTPPQYSTMVVVGGGIGIVGNVVAGSLGDRYGRRLVGFVTFALLPPIALAFYNGPEWVLGVAFMLIVFTSNASDVVTRAFSSELFPTSQRSTSAGWLTLVSTLGHIAGLVVVGREMDAGADLMRAISAVSLAVLIAAVLVLFLPESRGRELETLSHEG